MIKLLNVPPVRYKKWYCVVHKRYTSYRDKNNKPCCEPGLPGILAFCECWPIANEEKDDKARIF